MKGHTRLLSIPILIAASLMLTHVAIHAMGTDLIWTVVTSEDDFGPGTLREAIDAVNNVGSGTEVTPNAIAFAKSVKLIQLQSPLPTVEVPVLIDGLAKVSNGTVVQEGNCDALPSPASDPCAFSCALRVTIDGSTIPLLIAPDRQVGLESNSDDVTIRGIRIINITTPDPDSIAIGINLNGMNNRVECCEVDTIRNTAGSSDSPNENFAAGITGSNEYYINKTYVHNIQGGLINIECELIPNNSDLVSGSAYGITGQIHVTDSRVEQVESGSIVACTPTIGSETNITLKVGFTAGIFFDSFAKQLCPDPISCSECVACPLSGTNISVSVENSVVTTIIGGSIISTINNVNVLQDSVVGISLRAASFNYLIRNNNLSTIHGGSATLSGNSTTYRRLGIGGIFTLTGDINCISCNTITDVLLGTIQASGYNTQVDPSAVVGISCGNNEDIIECNTVSQINGGTILIQGDCSIVVLPGEGVKSRTPNKIANIPGGATCFQEALGSALGISAISNASCLIARNTVSSISGGKRVISSAGTQAATLGSIGISVGAQVQSPAFSLVESNSVYAISGPLLAAKAGGNLIQNLQGTVGITVNSFIAEVQNNCVQNITEGKVQVSQQSIVAHFTDLQDLHLKMPLLIDKQAVTNPEAWFVPVVTAGIAVAGPESNRSVITQIEPATGPPFIRIHDNTINTISGAVVPGGQLPLGSIAVGIFAQPSFTQITEQPFGFVKDITKESILEEICADNRLLNFIVGDVNTNTIQSVSGGTNAPSYGICLDGSRLSLFSLNIGSLLLESLFSIDSNSIKTIKGNGRIEPFILTDQQLGAVLTCCVDLFGPGTQCDLPNNFVPLLPFEPTSGIYTLFGGCSQISSNTITSVTDTKDEARGITTAASSDMNIFDNILSHIKGYGIFVGGAFVDEMLLTGTEFIFKELLPSLRNKIYNNSTVNNTNNGIELGLIDWNYFVFARNTLNACKQLPLRIHQEAPEDSSATYGNHGQVAPCIKKVTCNRNGTITIDITLTGTLPVTKFIIQFFKNSANSVPHGEQHISTFDDQNFVLRTDINGNVRARFTFLPLLPLTNSDIISAHVTVTNDPLSPAGNAFFGDTSEFSHDMLTVCPVTPLMQPKPAKPKPSFANLCQRG